MSAEAPDTPHARAIEWHIRLRDGDDASWDAFADWLAEDPAHADAYDLIERTDLAIEPLLPSVVIREDDVAIEELPERRVWPRRLVAGGLAASLAILLAVTLIPREGGGRYEIATRAGERRVVTLDGATQVTLNGATRMTFDRSDARFAALASGEAFFKVRHDSERPFRLEVAGKIVEDAGTAFNVVHQAGEVRVAVAEGKVIYNPGREGISLDAGQALVDRDTAIQVSVTRVPTESVGTWQTGTLTYSAAALSQVAADLERALGVKITVATQLSNRPFSGTIILDKTGTDQFRRLRLALNVDFEKTSDGWIMKPAGSEGH
jgi:transmembrane sensor